MATGPERMEDLRRRRAELRRESLRRRERLARDLGPSAAASIREHGLRLLASLRPAPAVIAGYVPVRGEPDIMPLLRALAERGHDVALPVVAEENAPLIFRRWRPDMHLLPGAYGIPVPPPTSAELVPDVVLVPLAAFDRAGHRLGYGGGYYDRTLARLRAERRGRPDTPTAIGCAYAGQELQAIPALETDERLDWVLTEQGARRLAPR